MKRAMKVDKVYVGAAILVLVVAVLGYMFLQGGITGQVTGQMDSQQAAERVRLLYALQYETSPVIVSINETSGLYNVILQLNVTGSPTLQQVFITKDGKLIADRFIVADNYLKFLNMQKSFVDCLVASNVRIFGGVNDTNTVQQLAVLGNYGYRLFVSCDPPNTQACIDYGVKKIPTTAVNSTGYDAGIYNLDFYSQMTGCQLQTV